MFIQTNESIRANKRAQEAVLKLVAIVEALEERAEHR